MPFPGSLRPGGINQQRTLILDGCLVSWYKRICTDTPAFEVTIALYFGGAAASNSTVSALLRSSESGIPEALTTSGGVVAWSALQLLGWPGRYLLHVQAAAYTLNEALPKVSGWMRGMCDAAAGRTCQLAQRHR
jgi:hypothetical protein